MESSPLQLAAKNGDVDKVRELMKSGSYNVNRRDGWFGKAPLHLACKHGHLDAIRVLISEFKADLANKDEDGATPLHSACVAGQVVVLRALLSEFKADMTLQDLIGQTPLHVACVVGKSEVVRALVSEFQADLTVRDKRGRTALMLATQSIVNPSLSVASTHDYLRVADVLIKKAGADRKTLLFLLFKAIELGEVNVVATLIGRDNTLIDARTGKGDTPLQFAASLCNCSKEIAKLLIENGGDLSGDAGVTLLIKACASNNVNFVDSLIQKDKTLINARATNGDTPLHFAATQTDLKQGIAKLLIEKGGDLSVDVGVALLVKACASNNINFVDYLIQKDKTLISARIGNGNTPLHLAATQTDLEKEIAKLLIESGGNLSVDIGEILIKACISNNINLVDAILENSISPLVTDSDGNTPLHIASRHNHIRCAESLVRANAPLMVRNGDGKTPMDVASGQSKTFLEQYFEKNKIQA